MDYSQLSDFEINRMVGDIIFKGLWACKPETSGNNTNKWYYGNADTTFEDVDVFIGELKEQIEFLQNLKGDSND